MPPPRAEPAASDAADAAVLAMLRDSARRFPNKTALRRGPDALTYDGLLREIEKRARRIDRTEWVPLEAADPVAFVTSFFAARLAKTGAVAHGVQIPALLRERREALLARWRPAGEESRTVFFSSGSVGDGRPVPLGDREILAAASGYPESTDIEPSDCVAVGVSPAHVFGFVRGTIHPLSIGAEIVFFSPRRDPLAEAEAIGGTLVLLPGPLVSLSGRPSRRVRLRAVFSGGGALSEEAVSAVEQRRGVPVRLGYGLTETAGLGSRQRLSLPRRPGTSGLPAPTLAISIGDFDSGVELPPGRTGGIRIAGTSVFGGYAGDESPNPFDERGRLETGDLGYFDEQGELVVRGRREFCIITQGRTLFAEEIEGAVGEHPGVLEVAVAPHGDSFAVLFVAREGASALDAEIREFLQARLPAFARPRKVLSVEALPRHPSGKLDRRTISSWLA